MSSTFTTFTPCFGHSIVCSNHCQRYHAIKDMTIDMSGPLVRSRRHRNVKRSTVRRQAIDARKQTDSFNTLRVLHISYWSFVRPVMRDVLYSCFVIFWNEVRWNCSSSVSAFSSVCFPFNDLQTRDRKSSNRRSSHWWRLHCLELGLQRLNRYLITLLRYRFKCVIVTSRQT